MARQFPLAVVQTDGRVVTWLPNATITENPTWELNTYGTMAFSLPIRDAVGHQVQRFDEVALFCNSPSGNAVLWWGLVVSITLDLDDDTATRSYRCAGLEWYFDKRYIGKASRTNYVTDPSFEAPPASPDYGAWASVGTVIFDKYNTSRYKLDTHSGRIVSASALQNWYAYQDVLGFTATGVGDVLTAVAWYFIEDDGSFTGPAIGDFGLVLIPYNGGVAEPQDSGFATGLIPGDAPKGSWQRLRVSIYLPPDVTRDIQIRLYAIGGTIHWDAIQLVRMESLSSVSSATDFTSDQAKILEMLCQHAQDTSLGKSDLSIGSNCPDTGVRRERHYQYADHANILRSMQEFPSLDNGCDFYITFDPTGGGLYSRTFRTAYPHRGTDHAADKTVRLIVDDENGAQISPWLKSFQLVDDGNTAVTAVTVLGQGDGADREEAGAALTGVVTVEEVISAPASVDIDALDETATSELAHRQTPWQVTMVVDQAEDDANNTWLTGVSPGDTLPTYLRFRDDSGADVIPFDSSLRLRVMSKTLDLESEAVTLVCNRVLV